ncbi:MAG: hypothetical protein LIP01_05510 [Tannerellaceae bacterium]|nr:hypothetical protein [Tannerellaceae bacterium]
MPDWFKAYKEENDQKLAGLLAENEKFKAEQAKTQRTAAINAKAQELGIPESLMKRFHMNDDEDIEQVLTAYKQDLVTNKLMPEDAGGGIKVPDESATKSEAVKLLGQYTVSE